MLNHASLWADIRQNEAQLTVPALTIDEIGALDKH
jgi:hypothetical protein